MNNKNAGFGVKTLGRSGRQERKEERSSIVSYLSRGHHSFGAVVADGSPDFPTSPVCIQHQAVQNDISSLSPTVDI